MSILVIGGDHLGNIKDKLNQKGFDEIGHITGRKKRDRKIKISQNTDLVLVLTDFIGHNMVEIIKEESRKNNVSVIFSRRSWTCMYKNIEEYINRR